MELHPKRRVAAWIGGVAACILLIGAGIAYIVIGVNGRDEVKHNVSRELIVGTPDMTPALITAALAEAGLKDVQDIPTCSAADKPVTNGTESKCFASYMRMHALESSSGLTYAQMGRFQLAATQAARRAPATRSWRRRTRQASRSQTAHATHGSPGRLSRPV